ncbi:MAG: type II secretion system minor pseudopilin GspI [Pseudomonadota bacterium]
MRKCEAGFTLIEMMVALAVFSLAALALLRLQGVTLKTTADLDRRTTAQLIARNMQVEILTDPAPPTVGDTAGAIANGGRQLNYVRSVTRDNDPRFVLVTLSVGGAPGASPAVLSFVRRAK